MKLKIKVKTFGDQQLPEIVNSGDWIDLRYYGPAVFLNKDEFKILGLGVAMKLPEGFEAVVVSRSSTFKNFMMFNPGAVGVIDNSYCGSMDEWKYPAYALGEKKVIHSGDRICQFRIQLSQKATFWQKMKWLLSSGIKLEKVEKLNTINRGGLGSSGIK